MAHLATTSAGAATQPLDPMGGFRLAGRVALVTGASSGLGHRFARVLDAVGARVAIVARRAERLEQLAAGLADPLPLVRDLSEPGAPEAVVADVETAWGPVDVLVNNAGVSVVEPAFSEDPDRFRRILEVNLVAPYALARRVAHAAVEAGRGCSIVNIASIHGLGGARHSPQAGYAASKGGLVNLTRELAEQWARRGVRVNAIAPGWFRSEATSGAIFERPEGLEYVRRYTPMRRPGEEHELDGALLFLASDASSYVTGQVLVVDGGWTAV